MHLARTGRQSCPTIFTITAECQKLCNFNFIGQESFEFYFLFFPQNINYRRTCSRCQRIRPRAIIGTKASLHSHVMAIIQGTRQRIQNRCSINLQDIQADEIFYKQTGNEQSKKNETQFKMTANSTQIRAFKLCEELKTSLVSHLPIKLMNHCCNQTSGLLPSPKLCAQYLKGNQKNQPPTSFH